MLHLSKIIRKSEMMRGMCCHKSSWGRVFVWAGTSSLLTREKKSGPYLSERKRPFLHICLILLCLHEHTHAYTHHIRYWGRWVINQSKQLHITTINSFPGMSRPASACVDVANLKRHLGCARCKREHEWESSDFWISASHQVAAAIFVRGGAGW